MNVINWENVCPPQEMEHLLQLAAQAEDFCDFEDNLSLQVKAFSCAQEQELDDDALEHIAAGICVPPFFPPADF